MGVDLRIMAERSMGLICILLCRIGHGADELILYTLVSYVPRYVTVLLRHYYLLYS